MVVLEGYLRSPLHFLFKMLQHNAAHTDQSNAKQTLNNIHNHMQSSKVCERFYVLLLICKLMPTKPQLFLPHQKQASSIKDKAESSKNTTSSPNLQTGKTPGTVSPSLSPSLPPFPWPGSSIITYPIP